MAYVKAFLQTVSYGVSPINFKCFYVAFYIKDYLPVKFLLDIEKIFSDVFLIE